MAERKASAVATAVAAASATASALAWVSAAETVKEAVAVEAAAAAEKEALAVAKRPPSIPPREGEGGAKAAAQQATVRARKARWLAHDSPGPRMHAAYASAGC